MFSIRPWRVARGIGVTTVTTLMVLGLGAFGAVPASASQGGLLPDVPAYCMMNPPFGMQVAVNDWRVVFDKVTGDTGQNNWGCRYLTMPTVPAGVNNFTIPWPIPSTQPMDWNALCNQQFPGAHAKWIPGPMTGVGGAPWECEGPEGVTYDLAEQTDGTHLVTSNPGGGW
jgi:hypothetical protein